MVRVRVNRELGWEVYGQGHHRVRDRDMVRGWGVTLTCGMVSSCVFRVSSGVSGASYGASMPVKPVGVGVRGWWL